MKQKKKRIGLLLLQIGQFETPGYFGVIQIL